MELPSRLIEAAVDQMASLPGVGRKTALRLVLNLLNRSDEQVDAFAEAFQTMKKGIHACQQCHNLTEAEVCSICADPARNEALVCVVEDIRDLLALESTGQYRGKYHVLGGVISPMDGIGPELLNVTPLVERINREDITEVILALTPSVEGDTTSLYLARLLKPFCSVSRIAYGLPMGSELEYADEVTLSRALEGRRPVD